MALTITQQPGNVSFAGNPILVKAKTSLSGKTFMRIVAEVEVTAETFGSSYTYAESYTYSVAGAEQAVFNVAETVNAAIRRYSVQQVGEGSPKINICRASYKVTLKEVYLDQMVEITGATVALGPFTAIQGQLSDYELSLLPNQDTEAYIGSGMVLSRKPDGEVVYGAHPVYIPAVVTADKDVVMSVNRLPAHGGEKVLGGVVYGHAYMPVSVMSDAAKLPDGVYNFSVTPMGHAYTTRKYISARSESEHCSFLFLNGFGILESVTALTGKSCTHRVQQDHYIEVGPIGSLFPDAINVGGPSWSETKVTSGFVTREWADWWCTEFLVSRKVWMRFGSRYLPVSAVSDSVVTITDPTRPGLCEVKFTVRCAFSGSTVSVVR